MVSTTKTQVPRICTRRPIAAKTSLGSRSDDSKMSHSQATKRASSPTDQVFTLAPATNLEVAAGEASFGARLIQAFEELNCVQFFE